MEREWGHILKLITPLLFYVSFSCFPIIYFLSMRLKSSTQNNTSLIVLWCYLGTNLNVNPLFIWIDKRPLLGNMNTCCECSQHIA